MSSVHSPQYQELLQRLRAARERAGMTQSAVAAKLRKPQSYVSKCESGERRLDVVELLRLAALYRAAPSVLLRGLSDPKPTRRSKPRTA